MRALLWLSTFRKAGALRLKHDLFRCRRQNALTQSPQSFDSTNNIKSQLNAVNFGVEGNAGITSQLGKGNIFIEGGFNYGFINIQKGTPNSKNNIGAGTVTLGYTYPLEKKK